MRQIEERRPTRKGRTATAYPKPIAREHISLPAFRVLAIVVQRVPTTMVRVAGARGLNREALARLRMLEAVAADVADVLESNVTGAHR